MVTEPSSPIAGPGADPAIVPQHGVLRDRYLYHPHVHDVDASPQLRRLLDAVVTVGSELDLATVLQRIVGIAIDLVDARYGALGVLDEDGDALTDFIPAA